MPSYNLSAGKGRQDFISGPCEKNGIYHALNRGNARATIFREDPDYEAFEETIAEGLARNRWRLVHRPTKAESPSDFLRWVTLTHTKRYDADYPAAGEGRVDQGRFKNFPTPDDGPFHVWRRYVERHALRTALIEQAEAWRWGSLKRCTRPWSRTRSCLARGNCRGAAARWNTSTIDKTLDIQMRFAPDFDATVCWGNAAGSQLPPDTWTRDRRFAQR
ncbi:MAG: hypothetical protein AAF961_10325 [Planctomycetota bacterium]